MPRNVPAYTIQDPTIESVKTILFSSQSNGSGGSVTIYTAAYELVDENDAVVVTGSVSAQLGGTPLSQLATYITNHVLPAIVTAENL